MSGGSDDLSRYRWHTGASLRRVHPDEALPVLFRDVGPVALRAFLVGTLPRLAGPYTPLLYMRTASFVEPFVDHAGTGRLVLLRARALDPWHSGVPEVYVARADRPAPPESVGYVPGDVDLAAVAAAAPADAAQLREHLGGPAYDERREHDREALRRLNDEAARSEQRAQPLRQALQSRDRDRRARARAVMEAAGIDDQALCAAWHHLPRHTREHLDAALAHVDLAALAAAPEGP